MFQSYELKYHNFHNDALAYLISYYPSFKPDSRIHTRERWEFKKDLESKTQFYACTFTELGEYATSKHDTVAYELTFTWDSLSNKALVKKKTFGDKPY